MYIKIGVAAKVRANNTINVKKDNNNLLISADKLLKTKKYPSNEE